MPDRPRLEALLRRLDRRSYPAYRELRGRWRLGDLELIVDHVQGDPFAAPSRLRLRVPTGIRPTGADHRVAAEDWLLRRFVAALDRRPAGRAHRGSGKSGTIEVYRPGPEVVERSAVRLHDDGTAELRLAAGLPAAGRRILGFQALGLLLEDLPEAAGTLRDTAADPSLAAHVHSVCLQRALRRRLREYGLVAFVADGAVLPRASGVDRSPLRDAVPFKSPDSLRVTLETPEGSVVGMGLPPGVTLITGGGFHGKSTLLRAIQTGHLDFVPGDGRERVVADPDTVKIRAEDGRRVAAVDISPFLRDLPGGRTTAPFSTEDASGSTSQAAAIVEAVEAGARVLLLDEDTSATNLLVRDQRMRRLVPREREPITPLVERVRQIREVWGVSTIMVIGGVGDYLAVADRVIRMVDWQPEDVTALAHRIAGPPPEPPGPLAPVADRVLCGGVAPTGKGRVRAHGDRRVEYGRAEVDLVAVEQVTDAALARSIGHAMRLVHELLERRGEATLGEVLAALEERLADEGPDVLSPFPEPVGDLLRPRRHEVAAALNRLRSVVVRGSEAR